MLLRGDQFYLYILWDDGLRRGCKLVFRKDGTVIVVLPIAEVAGGLLATVPLDGGQGISQSFKLSDFGKVTKSIVKYSHHPDGHAHFSQDGRIFTQVRRKAATLDTQRGHLFSLILQRFDLYPTEQLKTGKNSLQFSCDMPTSRTVKFIVSRHKTTEQGTIRQAHEGYLTIAPPSSYALSDRYLCVVLREVLEFDSGEGPGLVFVGGFDDLDIAMDQSRPTAFLAAMYPCSDYDSLRAKIGSVDYSRGPNEP